MAFIPSPTLLVRAPPRRQGVSRRRAAAPAMATPPPQGGASTPESEAGYALGSDGYELDTDALKDKALEVVTDVGARPLYYGKIVGYGAGALVTLTVLRAVVAAVDSIPVLPGALELVGLGYTAWFVWRYVLFKESREELLEEIEEFLGRAKPGPQ